MIVLQILGGAGRQAAVAAAGRRGHAGLCLLDSLHSQHGVVARPAEQYACCQGHLVSGSLLCIPPAVDPASPICKLCMNVLNRTSCLFGSQLPPPPPPPPPPRTLNIY